MSDETASADSSGGPARLDRGVIEAIRAAGRASGLTDCGIATLEPSVFGDALDAWLRRGAHGTMEWMATTAAIRKDVRARWDWARSALVAVQSYLTDTSERRAAPGIVPHLARYALGQDYHDVVRGRLATWGRRVEAVVGREYRRALITDTSAILERELAVRAGLGWIGKNTCLIGPRGDSWRFIGVLLTDLELPPPATVDPFAERCGTCRACLDACPTQAFPQAWVLDATRCISYLTIEHRGPITGAAAEGLGEWVFGCDVCQEVCPWNHRATADGAPVFAARPAYALMSLAELARLDVPAFRARFSGTPLERTKRAGLVRNALIAGANLRDPEVLAAARDLVDDPEEAVREAARWALSLP